MTSLDRLTLYMTEAIRRTTAREYRTVSAALIPVLPDLVSALKSVITDHNTTPAQRLQSAEMLMTLFARCLRDEDRKQKHLTRREQLKIKKTKVEADDRKAKLAIVVERRKIDETLKRAKAEMESR